MKKRWYETAGLKHVTGFLTEAEKDSLRKLAEAQDRSLVKYVSLILKAHLKTNVPIVVAETTTDVKIVPEVPRDRTSSKRN